MASNTVARYKRGALVIVLTQLRHKISVDSGL